MIKRLLLSCSLVVGMGLLVWLVSAETLQAAQNAMQPCVVGMAAGTFACNNFDLLAHLPQTEIGGSDGNDLWGWTDPLTSKEYVIMGRRDGTSFVDVSDPVNPIYLADLPATIGNAVQRDIKVLDDHALIVSESAGHGMQIYDLTELRTLPLTGTTTITHTAIYTGFLRAHNIAVNHQSHKAFGIRTPNNEDGCGNGLHILDMQNPLVPVFEGCYDGPTPIHDTQCIIYNGPDSDYSGRELCFNAAEASFSIVDITDPTNPILVANEEYAGNVYAHQGWLSSDLAYFFMNDELDERVNGHNTQTYIWDVTDLDNPAYHMVYVGPTTAVDHNLYTRGRHVYEANYNAGLRILDAHDVANKNVTEIAYFDTYPTNDSDSWSGAWSVYPYFPSNTIAVSTRFDGLFLLKMHTGIIPTAVAVNSINTQPDDLTLHLLLSVAGLGLVSAGALIKMTNKR